MSAPSPINIELESVARDAYFSDALLSADEIASGELGLAVRDVAIAEAGPITYERILLQTRRLETLLELFRAETDGVENTAPFPSAAQLFLHDHNAFEETHAANAAPCERFAPPVFVQTSAIGPADDYVARIAQQLLAAENNASAA